MVWELGETTYQWRLKYISHMTARGWDDQIVNDGALLVEGEKLSAPGAVWEHAGGSTLLVAIETYLSQDGKGIGHPPWVPDLE